MADPVPPSSQEPTSWYKDMPSPIRWIVASAAGIALAWQFIPPALLAWIAQIAPTPVGLGVFLTVCTATAVGFSLRSGEKRINAVKEEFQAHVTSLKDEVKKCHDLRDEEKEHCEGQFRRAMGVILLFAKGDSEKAQAEALKFLGE